MLGKHQSNTQKVKRWLQGLTWRGFRQIALSPFFVLSLLVFASCAPQSPRSGDSPATFTAYLNERIPALMQQYEVPGLSTALNHGRNLIWSQAYGYADRDRRRTITVDAIYRTESISKSVTA